MGPRLTEALATLALLAACATPSAGRYMQQAHPLTGDVFAQWTWPTGAGCAAMTKEIARAALKAKDREPAQEITCSEASASNFLPVRATLRDKANNYLWDVETKYMLACAHVLQAFAADANVEVVSDCRLK